MGKVRIRYKETKKENTLKSVKDIISDSTNARYVVYLDTKNCTYLIRNINSGRKYEGGENINNLHVLKRNVKKRLKNLGVNFNSEIRDNSGRIPGVNCNYKHRKDKNDQNRKTT